MSRPSSSSQPTIDLHRPTQWRVFRDPARFKVLVSGRRMGKSFYLMAEMLKQALGYKHQEILYVAPTRQQAKDIMWAMLKANARAYLAESPKETELRLYFITGSSITLIGAEAHDRARGRGYDLVCFDEFADIAPEAWFESIRPALADRQGKAIFCGTPKGWNHFYDLFISAKDLPDWASYSFTTLEGGRVPADEVGAARATMSERQFRQEYEASFESMEGRVYREFDREKSVAMVPDNKGPLHIGMDFNVAPMTAVVMVQAGDQYHVIDEIEMMNSNTTEMAQEILSRYKGRDITVYPDPSGRSRKTSAPVGQSDFSILTSHGLRLVASRSAPPVVDRINEVNAVLCNANGDRRLFVHPKCKSLIKALDGLVYKEGTSQPDKASGLDHITDALGYAVHELAPLVRRQMTSQRFRWA